MSETPENRNFHADAKKSQISSCIIQQFLQQIQQKYYIPGGSGLFFFEMLYLRPPKRPNAIRATQRPDRRWEAVLAKAKGSAELSVGDGGEFSLEAGGRSFLVGFPY